MSLPGRNLDTGDQPHGGVPHGQQFLDTSRAFEMVVVRDGLIQPSPRLVCV